MVSLLEAYASCKVGTLDLIDYKIIRSKLMILVGNFILKSLRLVSCESIAIVVIFLLRILLVCTDSYCTMQFQLNEPIRYEKLDYVQLCVYILEE